MHLRNKCYCSSSSFFSKLVTCKRQPRALLFAVSCSPTAERPLKPRNVKLAPIATGLRVTWDVAIESEQRRPDHYNIGYGKTMNSLRFVKVDSRHRSYTIDDVGKMLTWGLDSSYCVVFIIYLLFFFFIEKRLPQRQIRTRSHASEDRPSPPAKPVHASAQRQAARVMTSHQANGDGSRNVRVVSLQNDERIHEKVNHEPDDLYEPKDIVVRVMSAQSVLVTWVDPAYEKQKNVGANRHYTVRYREKGESARWDYKETSQRRLIVDRLSPDNMYEFSIRASQGSRDGKWSVSVFQRTPESAPTGPPENFHVEPLKGKGTVVTASWDEPAETSGKIKEYILSYAPALKPFGTKSISYPGDTTSAIVDGLQAGERYIFKIRAANRRGQGPQTKALTVVMPSSNTSQRSKVSQTDEGTKAEVLTPTDANPEDVTSPHSETQNHISAGSLKDPSASKQETQLTEEAPNNTTKKARPLSDTRSYHSILTSVRSKVRVNPKTNTVTPSTLQEDKESKELKQSSQQRTTSQIPEEEDENTDKESEKSYGNEEKEELKQNSAIPVETKEAESNNVSNNQKSSPASGDQTVGSFPRKILPSQSRSSGNSRTKSNPYTYEALIDKLRKKASSLNRKGSDPVSTSQTPSSELPSGNSPSLKNEYPENGYPSKKESLEPETSEPVSSINRDGGSHKQREGRVQSKANSLSPTSSSAPNDDDDDDARRASSVHQQPTPTVAKPSHGSSRPSLSIQRLPKPELKDYDYESGEDKTALDPPARQTPVSNKPKEDVKPLAPNRHSNKETPARKTSSLSNFHVPSFIKPKNGAVVPRRVSPKQISIPHTSSARDTPSSSGSATSQLLPPKETELDPDSLISQEIEETDDLLIPSREAQVVPEPSLPKHAAVPEKSRTPTDSSHSRSSQVGTPIHRHSFSKPVLESEDYDFENSRSKNNGNNPNSGPGLLKPEATTIPPLPKQDQTGFESPDKKEKDSHQSKSGTPSVNSPSQPISSGNGRSPMIPSRRPAKLFPFQQNRLGSSSAINSSSSATLNQRNPMSLPRSSARNPFGSSGMLKETPSSSFPNGNSFRQPIQGARNQYPGRADTAAQDKRTESSGKPAYEQGNTSAFSLSLNERVPYFPFQLERFDEKKGCSSQCMRMIVDLDHGVLMNHEGRALQDSQGRPLRVQLGGDGRTIIDHEGTPLISSDGLPLFGHGRDSRPVVSPKGKPVLAVGGKPLRDIDRIWPKRTTTTAQPTTSTTTSTTTTTTTTTTTPEPTTVPTTVEITTEDTTTEPTIPPCPTGTYPRLDEDGFAIYLSIHFFLHLFLAPYVNYIRKDPGAPCSLTEALEYLEVDILEDLFSKEAATGPPQNKPHNITVVAMEGCHSFVILDWARPLKGDMVSGYMVHSASYDDVLNNRWSSSSSSGTHLAVENLKPNARYYFKVQAKNIFGLGPISDTFTYVTESGGEPIWIPFSFKYNPSSSSCKGSQFVKRTWYRKFVGVVLCNSLRYKMFMGEGLRDMFYNIGDSFGRGEDHCQFVDSHLEGRTGPQTTLSSLPTIEGYHRAFRQEPVTFGLLGDRTPNFYVGWYECGIPIPGKW
uniref:Fibronectin type-III domain-containing protein n=1 Tax=Erpetoichthys calabaricus TaxID=27687 RepID=A0A8C4T490_ERPCA